MGVAPITPLGYHAPDRIMITRKTLPAIALSSLLTLVLLAACGGGENETGTIGSGQLTDPRSVPTATPWAKPPEAIFLEPGAIKPLGGGGQEGGQSSQGGGQTTPGQCGKTYTVQAGDYPGLIAEKCGVDVNKLMEINGITDPTKLQVGQELKLP